jgi:hypothetical protein
MANNAQSFKAPQCEKRAQWTDAAAQKVGCGTSHQSGLYRRLNRICARQFMGWPFRAVGLDEARRHELDKFRERVAVLGAEFRQPFRE